MMDSSPCSRNDPWVGESGENAQHFRILSLITWSFRVKRGIFLKESFHLRRESCNQNHLSFQHENFDCPIIFFKLYQLYGKK